ncbi:MAG: hypothetical protein M3033_09095 [Acidobacteriota bacterium]|nr:hypothetical protein [Acidobacteriota bacterium]
MEDINILSYETCEENGLSFELILDGKPLADYVKFKDTKIPYWIIDKGLPRYGFDIEDKIDERIVAVCSCGEYGCDCVLCEVQFDNQFVTLKGFRRERGSDLKQVEFKLNSENFHDIESKISKDAEKYNQEK